MVILAQLLLTQLMQLGNCQVLIVSLLEQLQRQYFNPVRQRGVTKHAFSPPVWGNRCFINARHFDEALIKKTISLPLFFFDLIFATIIIMKAWSVYIHLLTFFHEKLQHKNITLHFYHKYLYFILFLFYFPDNINLK